MRSDDDKMKWNQNPYLAPLTEPLRIIGRGAMTPMNPFLKALRKGFSATGEINGRTLPGRIFRELRNSNNFGVSFSTLAGGAIAAMGTAAMTLTLMTASLPVLLATSAVAATAAFALAPIAIMTALGAAGAFVGAVCSPLGIVDGCRKALRYRQEQKTAPPAPPPVSAAERIVQAALALPERERPALAKALQERIGASFGAATASLPSADNAAAGPPPTPANDAAPPAESERSGTRVWHGGNRVLLERY